jgi:hypothetical protein
MPKCVVRLRDTLEIQHSVVVYAESLYEAVVRGLNQLAEVGWESHADETIKQVEVEIYQEPTRHVVDVPKLLKWINQDAKSPRQQTLKEKLRTLLGRDDNPTSQSWYALVRLAVNQELRAGTPRDGESSACDSEKKRVRGWEDQPMETGLHPECLSIQRMLHDVAD